jgi:hypothetical protein
MRHPIGEVQIEDLRRNGCGGHSDQRESVANAFDDPI